MKKQNLILFSIVTMLIVPQFAFAVWWNPTTWSIFSFLFDTNPRVETPVTSTNEIALEASTTSAFGTIATSTKEEIVVPTVSVTTKKVPTEVSTSSSTSVAQPKPLPIVQEVPPQVQIIQQVTPPTPVQDTLNQPDNQVNISLLSPNGGKTFKTGDLINIKWSSSNVPRIYFALTDATGDEQISNLLNVKPRSGEATWQVSSNVPSGAYKLKIGAYDTTDTCGDGTCSMHHFLATDISDSTFNITQILPVTTEPKPERTITFVTPTGGEIYYTAKSSYPKNSGKIGWATEGDTIPFTWKWTGSTEYRVWPVVYLHNSDTGSNVGEYIPANYNNYSTSQGYITSLKRCLNGLFCPTGFAPGHYQLRLCEFPDDGNPSNNALYPVGKTPLCVSSSIFSIQDPVNELDETSSADQQATSTTQ